MTEQHINTNTKETAILFDIQRFSVNDGPGIRTNLFFKGCPLRCIWCHNPESYLPGKQLSFQRTACTGCQECIPVCPQKVNQAVQVGQKTLISVDYEKCRACGLCTEVCCYDARSVLGKEYSIAELKEQILIDAEYYKILDKDGQPGGITLTGGEPMSQFRFINQFLNELEGIHVCMETSGYAPWWQYEKLLGRVNQFLFDYKVTNPQRHKELCGVDNRLILDNLRCLCAHGQDIVLRLPMIPGVNDDDEHFRAIADIINQNPNIRRGEIMAYHSMGISKAEDIGLDADRRILRYNGESATEEQKKAWLSRFKELGLERIQLG